MVKLNSANFIFIWVIFTDPVPTGKMAVLGVMSYVYVICRFGSSTFAFTLVAV